MTEPITRPRAPELEEPPPGAGASSPVWRRLGLAGFLFFLVKGLLWLAVPVAVAVWRSLTG